MVQILKSNKMQHEGEKNHKLKTKYYSSWSIVHLYLLCLPLDRFSVWWLQWWFLLWRPMGGRTASSLQASYMWHGLWVRFQERCQRLSDVQVPSCCRELADWATGRAWVAGVALWRAPDVSHVLRIWVQARWGRMRNL